MNCREFRAELRADGPAALVTAAANEHRAACKACDLDARALLLLHLGSPASTEQASSGFESRLRARIEREAPVPASPTWADGVGLVARPALAFASVTMLIVLGWATWAYLRSSADDFGLLAGTDPVFDSVLAGEIDGIGAVETSGTGRQEVRP